jgi:8-oxo-dGTP diphosphatase
MTVTFYDTNDVDRNVKFSVIAARYKEKWIFVRHKDRDTWEIAGGHIEMGESPFDAAKRELREETGATEFALHAICDYAVARGNNETFGRLYLADIYELGELEFKIEEIMCRISDI